MMTIYEQRDELLQEARDLAAQVTQLRAERDAAIAAAVAEAFSDCSKIAKSKAGECPSHFDDADLARYTAWDNACAAIEAAINEKAKARQA